MATQENGSQHRRTRDPQLSVPRPPTRSLQVYAVDPSAGKYSGNHVTVHVPWEPLHPGPTGSKIAVIDYDATNHCYYPPIDLDDPWLLANDGLNPTEADPRFHQQMVYAIASRTIQMFEVALGREIHWRRADRFGGSAENHAALRKRDDIRVLKLFPHAMQEANAYYSPQAHGILFGFFAANKRTRAEISLGSLSSHVCRRTSSLMRLPMQSSMAFGRTSLSPPIQTCLPFTRVSPIYAHCSRTSLSTTP